MTSLNISPCLCPNCKTDLAKSRYTQFHVHLYVDNFEHPNMAEKLRLLKSKRKLNKHVMESLLKPDIDLNYLKGFVTRLESVLEVAPETSLSRTLQNEINSLKQILKV